MASCRIRNRSELWTVGRLRTPMSSPLACEDSQGDRPNAFAFCCSERLFVASETEIIPARVSQEQFFRDFSKECWDRCIGQSSMPFEVDEHVWTGTVQQLPHSPQRACTFRSTPRTSTEVRRRRIVCTFDSTPVPLVATLIELILFRAWLPAI